MKKFKKIDDLNYIFSLFKNMSSKMEKIPISIYQSDQYFFTNLSIKYIEDKPMLKLEKNNLNLFEFEALEVTFFYKEIYFAFITRLIDEDEKSYIIETPTAIYSSFKRVVTRYKIPIHEQAFVYFNNDEVGFKIIDISTKGLSLASLNNFLQVGQFIRKIKIKISDAEFFCLEASVKHSKQQKSYYVFGLEFLELEWSQYNKLFSYIFSKTHSNLKSLNEFSSDEISKLYNRSRYANIRPKDEMESMFFDMLKKIESVHDKPNISTSLVYYKNNLPLIIGSTFKLYNQTFLGQHLLTLQRQKPNANQKMEVYLSLADVLLNNPQFKYYLSYIVSDLSWHADFLKNIEKIINDKKKFSFEYMNLLKYNICDFCVTKINEDYEICVVDSLYSFTEYCKDNLNELEINCYCFTKEEFFLDDIRESYKSFDIYITRKLYCVYKNGIPVSFVVAESGTDGINIRNFNDMSKVYFLDEELDYNAIINIIVPELIIFYSKYHKERFNLLFKDTLDINKISQKGLKYKYKMARVMMNKDGMSEFRKFLSARLNSEFI